MRGMTRRLGCVLVLVLGLGIAGPAHGAATCATPVADGAAHWTATLDATDAFGCHDGTLVNGAAFGMGIGTAFSLDGQDDYVSVPDHSLWTLGTRPFSISFWFKLSGSCPSSSWCVFVGASQGGGAQNKWDVHLKNGHLTFHVNFDGAASGTDVVSGPFSPVSGDWHHVAVTRDGNRFTILVDGSVLAVATNSISLPNPNANLTIGQAEDLGYFPGLIDEVQIVKGP